MIVNSTALLGTPVITNAFRFSPNSASISVDTPHSEEVEYFDVDLYTSTSQSLDLQVITRPFERSEYTLQFVSTVVSHV